MTEYTDTYVKAKSWADMKAFLVHESEGALYPNPNFQNLIAPAKGRAATKAFGTEGKEDYIPATEAKGDPQYWYACIRYDSAIELPAGVEPCTAEEAAPVIGVWA